MNVNSQLYEFIAEQLNNIEKNINQRLDAFATKNSEILNTIEKNINNKSDKYFGIIHEKLNFIEKKSDQNINTQSTQFKTIEQHYHAQNSNEKPDFNSNQITDKLNTIENNLNEKIDGFSSELKTIQRDPSLDPVVLDKLNNIENKLNRIINEFFAQYHEKMHTFEQNLFQKLSAELKKHVEKALSNKNNINEDEKMEVENRPVSIPGLRGLENEVNGCFMNSVIQALAHIPNFRKLCNNELYLRKSPVLSAIAPVINNLWSPNFNDEKITPTQLNHYLLTRNCYLFDKDQHDVYEFLFYLIGKMNDELKVDEKQDSSWDENNESKESNHEKLENPIEKLFTGSIKIAYTCNNCDYEKPKYDPTCSIDVPIPDTKKTVQLIDCLAKIGKKEYNVEMRCDKCKQSDMKLTRSYDKLANIIVMRLNRLNNSRRQEYKTNVLVEFPKYFEFGNESLELISVINHRSTTMSSGHYTTYAIVDSKWYEFNDRRVLPIHEEQLCSPEAYLLIYSKKDNTEIVHG